MLTLILESGSLKWISALDLESWSQTISARTIFPGLVADLIRASTDDIRSFRFPSGDKGQIRGFDGSLDANSDSEYIPNGRSIWEFGVSESALTKVNDDYKKRVKEIPSKEREKMVFVFVSLHTWDNPKLKLDDWILEKKAQNDWSDVKYIDGACLETWLDACPAVAARYARYELEKYPQIGARSTDEFWDEYSTRFDPVLTEEVLLCDRDYQVSSLLPKLVGELGKIQLAADSPDEVIAFAVAAIRKSKPEERLFLEARTLIVDTEEAARMLAVQNNLTFLPRAQASQIAGLLTKSGPTLMAFGGDQPSRDSEVLIRPSSESMGKAISAMGFSDDEGYHLARKCGRSVTILSRLIPAGTVSKPEWTKHGKDLLPALLAGGWEDTAAPDKDIVSKLASGDSYDDFEAKLRPLTYLQDPPIDRVQEVWKIRAPVDVFIYLGHMIGKDDLERFKQSVIQVFSCLEEAPPEPDELYKSHKENPGGYSNWLRDGLATTLLQIAVLSDQAKLVVSGSSPQQYVNDIVENLPGLSSDYRLISSLKNQLPLLAEAAPDPLVLALEKMLEGEADSIRGIFDEEDGLLFPQSKHTNLLWALELIAWDPSRLDRAALVLAKLASVDPGGRLSNRPINSLREIFISWSPSTNATVTQRTAVIELIIQHVPDIAWELLVKLFPRSHDTSSPTMKPHYREFGGSDKETLTYAVVWESQRNIINMALDMVGRNHTRLINIIEAMSDFEPELRERSVNLIDTYLLNESVSDNHREVWTALRDELNRHKSFPDADWSLLEGELEKINVIVKEHQPDNQVDRVSWLFDDWTPNIQGNIEYRDDLVNEARCEAISELIEVQGIDGILDLAVRAKLPQFVASSAVEIVNDYNLIKEVIIMSYQRKDDLDNFASMVSGLAAGKFKNSWVDVFSKLVESEKLSTELVLSHLLMWPDERSTWSVVAKNGDEIEKNYWKRKSAHLAKGTTDDLAFSMRQYMRFGRYTAAISVVHRRANEVPVELLFEILDLAVSELNSREAPADTMFSYYLNYIFEYLSQQDDIPDMEIARREYMYLPLIEKRDKTLTVHRVMASNPEFYMSVICDAFKASSAEAEEISKDKQDRARSAYRLLSSLKLLPGETEGSINLEELRFWIDEVHKQSVKVDREKIVDQYIGRLLAHAQIDKADNGWPDHTIRIIIDERGSDDIERGLIIERFNMRGVYSKALYEGGPQERALAEQYREWSKLADRWPRTSTMLETIASRWDNDANQADSEAEKDMMKN